jgi:glycosyltransferase involved in cell wall biosynthesis
VSETLAVAVDRKSTLEPALDLAGLRVAIVHDWLTGMRGGERVLEAMCELFPHAKLYTLVHVPGAVSARIAAFKPRTTFINRLPRAYRWYRHYLPLFPLAVEQINLDGFDLVLTSSHCAVKSVVVPGRARHLCYCHSPMRYAWDQFEWYFGPQRIGGWSRLAKPVFDRMARWDAATSGRPHRYLANSQYVAQRVRRYYNRRAAIVPPPVDTSFYTPASGVPEPYFLVVSALVPYKRIDVAIRACNRVQARLKIVGEGTERPRLEAIAGPTVEFLGRRSDEEVRECYRSATAVLLPGEEDFGIVPVEAQACGRPVVAFGRGGALETVMDGVSGVLVVDDGVETWAAALDRVQRTAFDPVTIRSNAERFSKPRFAAAFLAHVRELVEASPETARW